MLLVGKMEKMEPEDLYNDDWNIDEMEAKEELPEDLKIMMEDWKNNKSNGQSVSQTILLIILYNSFPFIRLL